MAENKKSKATKDEKGLPLAKIAKIFGETVNTLKDFLVSNGVKEAENFSPNIKINAEHYELLKSYFAKEDSEDIPKTEAEKPKTSRKSSAKTKPEDSDFQVADSQTEQESVSAKKRTEKVADAENDAKDSTKTKISTTTDSPKTKARVTKSKATKSNATESENKAETGEATDLDSKAEAEVYRSETPQIKGLTVKGKLAEDQIEASIGKRKKSSSKTASKAKEPENSTVLATENAPETLKSDEAKLSESQEKQLSAPEINSETKDKVQNATEKITNTPPLPELVVTKAEEEVKDELEIQNIDISDKIDTQYEKLAGPKVVGKIELAPDAVGRTRKRRIVVSRSEKPKKSPEEARQNRQAKARVTQEKVIDSKTIQEKIKETQEKLLQSSSRNLKSMRQKRRDKKSKQQQDEVNSENANKVVQVSEFLTLQEFASLLDVNFTEVIGKCMSLGLMVSINQRLDAEVMELIAEEYGFEIKFSSAEDEEPEQEEDREEDLLPCPPVVTVMGHVDHGKTSLIDYVRTTNVVAGEAGGITQKIGAYELTLPNGTRITFLDTPGHEAFTAMRARGTKVADIAVIIVAADDAVMPQTKEAISHAKAASTPMIFAINKIDKPGANPDKIKEQLAQMDVLVEDWGGKYQCQEISAKTGLNVDALLEKIILEAELLNLRANPKRAVLGTILDSRLDKGRGHMASVLVQAGTLRAGDIVASGQYYGKVKALFNERMHKISEAPPATPVLLLGLNGNPPLGERIRSYETESEARSIATKRSQIQREQVLRTRRHITLDEIGRRLALGNFKELNIILKADVDGTVEALSDALQQLSTEEIAVKIIHKGVGQIIESDVMLAVASDAIIIAFQVRPSAQAAKLAQAEDVQIKTYSVIYHVMDEIKSAMEGLMQPRVEEKTMANVEIKEIFKFDKSTVAGSKVLDGKLLRTHKIRVVRDGVVLHTGEIASLKHYKDDVKEMSAGRDCGIVLKNYNDIKVGDIIEAYIEEEVKRQL